MSRSVITVSLDIPTHRTIENTAKEMDCSKSDLMREAFEWLLSEHENEVSHQERGMYYIQEKQQQVRCTPELQEKIKCYCESTGSSKASFYITAIKHYIESKTPQKKVGGLWVM